MKFNIATAVWMAMWTHVEKEKWYNSDSLKSHISGKSRPLYSKAQSQKKNPQRKGTFYRFAIGNDNLLLVGCFLQYNNQT